MSPSGLVLAAGVGVREIAANASLLLLVGGLSMLSLIVVLVVLQSLFPDRGRAEGDNPTPQHQLRPLAGAAPPQRKATRTRRRRGEPILELPVDQALDRAVGMRAGEPRLMRVLPGFAHVRMYDCQSCAAGPTPEAACTESQRVLEESFREAFGPRTRVRETFCRQRGDATCDFEVRT